MALAVRLGPFFLRCWSAAPPAEVAGVCLTAAPAPAMNTVVWKHRPQPALGDLELSWGKSQLPLCCGGPSFMLRSQSVELWSENLTCKASFSPSLWAVVVASFKPLGAGLWAVQKASVP